MGRYAMSSIARIRLALTVLILSAVVVLITVPPPAAAQAEPKVLPPNSKAFGKSYGEWSEAWWKYALEAPLASSPFRDDTGAGCAERQTGKVFFLVGTFVSSDSVVRDKCTVRAGTALFFPLVNTVGLDPFPNETVDDLRDQAAAVIANPRLFASVDGKAIGNLTAYRAKSPKFKLNLPRPNILEGFGLTASTYDPVVADGYYLLLAPLSPGKHTLKFGGTADFANQDVTYHLTVENGR
jgi:hypothetical protein